jgi:hypothetical protein
LSPKSVYIGTPAYGDIAPGFVQSLVTVVTALTVAGWQVEVDMRAQCSLIAKARCEIADRFLQSKMANLFFVDADIEFDAADFFALLAFEEGVVGGSYRVKQKEVRFTCEPVSPQNAKGDFLECTKVGTGFMRIKREVLEKMHAPMFGNVKAYFNCRIEEGEYWGEDYAFCKDWRAQGGTVWVYPCTLKHYGLFAYEGTK